MRLKIRKVTVLEDTKRRKIMKRRSSIMERKVKTKANTQNL